MSRIVNNPWSFSAMANAGGFIPLRAVGDLAPQTPTPPPGGYPPGTNVLGIPGQPVTPEAIQWARRQIEKIRTAVGTGNLMFPAWLENYSNETPEIREHYLQMLTSESTIKAAVGTKVLSVMAQDVQVHPAEPTNARHKEAADNFKQCLMGIGVGQRSVSAIGPQKIAWSVLMPAIVGGWSVCEAVWKDAPEWRGKAKGKLFYRDFKSKDPRRLTPLVDEFKNLVGLRTNLDAGRVFAGDLLQDMVFFSYWSLFESPLGISDMRSAYRAWWIKNTARRLQALGLDRFTGPFLVGKYAAADQRAALEQALSDARAQGWLTMPVDAMVEVVNLATGTNEVFTAAIESCDKEMLMGILGSHLQLMEGQQGNRAGDTTEHAKQGDLFTWHLGSCLGGVISGQMAPSWYDRNYADIEPARVQWGGVVSVDEMVKRAGLDKQLQDMGYELDKVEGYTYYGRTQPATLNDVLRPPGQQPPPIPGMTDPDMPPNGPVTQPQRPQLGFNGDGETYPHEQRPEVSALGEDVKFFAEDCPAAIAMFAEFDENKHPRDAGKFAKAAREIAEKHPPLGNVNREEPPTVPEHLIQRLRPGATITPYSKPTEEERGKDPEAAAAVDQLFAEYNARRSEQGHQSHRWRFAALVNDMLAKKPPKPIQISPDPRAAGNRARKAIDRYHQDQATVEGFDIFDKYVKQVAASHPEGEQIVRAAVEEAKRRRDVSRQVVQEHIAALPPELQGRADKLLHKPETYGERGATVSRFAEGLPRPQVSDEDQVKIEAILARGKIKGWSTQKMAKKVSSETGIAYDRAHTIARTETSRGDHDDFLDEAERLGRRVRWKAGPHACPDCQARDGVVYSAKAASGMMPAHPNCNCEWEMVDKPRFDYLAFAEAYGDGFRGDNPIQQAVATFAEPGHKPPGPGGTPSL